MINKIKKYPSLNQNSYENAYNNSLNINYLNRIKNKKEYNIDVINHKIINKKEHESSDFSNNYTKMYIGKKYMYNDLKLINVNNFSINKYDIKDNKDLYSNNNNNNYIKTQNYNYKSLNCNKHLEQIVDKSLNKSKLEILNKIKHLNLNENMIYKQNKIYNYLNYSNLHNFESKKLNTVGFNSCNIKLININLLESLINIPLDAKQNLKLIEDFFAKDINSIDLNLNLLKNYAKVENKTYNYLICYIYYIKYKTDCSNYIKYLYELLFDNNYNKTLIKNILTTQVQNWKKAYILVLRKWHPDKLNDKLNITTNKNTYADKSNNYNSDNFTKYLLDKSLLVIEYAKKRYNLIVNIFKKLISIY